MKYEVGVLKRSRVNTGIVCCTTLTGSLFYFITSTNLNWLRIHHSYLELKFHT